MRKLVTLAALLLAAPASAGTRLHPLSTSSSIAGLLQLNPVLSGAAASNWTFNGSTNFVSDPLVAGVTLTGTLTVSQKLVCNVWEDHDCSRTIDVYRRTPTGALSLLCSVPLWSYMDGTYAASCQIPGSVVLAANDRIQVRLWNGGYYTPSRTEYSSFEYGVAGTWVEFTQMLPLPACGAPPALAPCIEKWVCTASGWQPQSKPAGTVCRAIAGVCDVPETCDVATATCPPDAFVSKGTECRASEGICDSAEACTGTSAACPGQSYAPPTKVCRPAAHPCDAADTCVGWANECSPDAPAIRGTPCPGNLGAACDGAGACMTSPTTTFMYPLNDPSDLTGLKVLSPLLTGQGYSYGATGGTLGFLTDPLMGPVTLSGTVNVILSLVCKFWEDHDCTFSVAVSARSSSGALTPLCTAYVGTFESGVHRTSCLIASPFALYAADRIEVAITNAQRMSWQEQSWFEYGIVGTSIEFPQVVPSCATLPGGPFPSRARFSYDGNGNLTSSVRSDGSQACRSAP